MVLAQDPLTPATSVVAAILKRWPAKGEGGASADQSAAAESKPEVPEQQWVSSAKLRRLLSELKAMEGADSGMKCECNALLTCPLPIHHAGSCLAAAASAAWSTALSVSLSVACVG